MAAEKKSDMGEVYIQGAFIYIYISVIYVMYLYIYIRLPRGRASHSFIALYVNIYILYISVLYIYILYISVLNTVYIIIF